MYGPNKFIQILRQLKESNFVFDHFKATKHGSRVVHLRHDVDFSVDSALNLAYIERKEEILSTYFFMLSSNTYNVFSKKNSDQIREIMHMGHKISLHFDPTSHQDIDSGFQKEKNSFEDFFTTKLDIISIHRPGVFLENNNRKLPGCSHTYEDRFFKDMVYLSDSGGKDVSEDLKRFIDNEELKELHLLLHPIWWEKEFQSPTQTLDNWLDRSGKFLKGETRKNCKTYLG
tara:strand:- start:10033 stop:10722 length:690 start_codon:yes stop_codon:yes gene_type:complete